MNKKKNNYKWTKYNKFNNNNNRIYNNIKVGKKIMANGQKSLYKHNNGY